MQFKNAAAQARWNQYVRRAADSPEAVRGYNQGVYWFAERWAAIMEVAIVAGHVRDEIAYRAAQLAASRTGGITGAMTGIAALTLDEVWAFGGGLEAWLKKSS